MVLKRFRKANLKLKPKKCKLFQKAVSFLGHVVSDKGIHTDPSKVHDLKNMSIPSNLVEIQSFLGFASYYRRFLADFSTLAAPLTALTRKNVKFNWTEACQNSFDEIVGRLTDAPVLAYPDPNEPFILDTDASGVGIGGVLSQNINGEERVIAYASKTLSKSQRNYCTTNRELLAVHVFVKHFRHYLLGRKFLLRCDHASLRWLMSFKEPEGMVARWISVLNTYDFDIEYREGSKHGNADGLSRLTPRRCKRLDCPDCYETHTKNRCTTQKVISDSNIEFVQVNTAPVSVPKSKTPQKSPKKVMVTQVSTNSQESSWVDRWSEENLKKWQGDDPAIRKIIDWICVRPVRPSWDEVQSDSRDLKNLWLQWKVLEVRNGILYRKHVPPEMPSAVYQLVAPKILRSKIMQYLHNNRTGGHMGVNKTVNLVRQRFYWSNYRDDVKLWCQKCAQCAQRKPGPHRSKAPLTQTLVGAPMERVAMDIMGPLPETPNGNQYILVVADYFTKWTESYALPNHRAITVAEAIVTQFITRFGVPKQLHSDQGRDFESNLIQEICKLLQIDKSRTTPYRPQSDGLVERFNRTLQNMLATLVNEHRNDWDDHLPYVMMAYRATKQDSTGCSPDLLMLGRECNLPIDVIAGTPPQEESPVCPVEYVQWVKDALSEAFEFSRRNLKRAAQHQKRNYDGGSKLHIHNVNDWVWYWYPPKARGKLSKGWVGPYLIIARPTDIHYIIQDNPRRKPRRVHVDFIKPCLIDINELPNNWLTQGSIDGSVDQPEPEVEDMVADQSVEDLVIDPEISSDDSFISEAHEPIMNRRGRVIRPPKRLDL